MNKISLKTLLLKTLYLLLPFLMFIACDKSTNPILYSSIIQKFAYISHSILTPEMHGNVYMMDINGKNLKRITNNLDSYRDIIFSPNGLEIAFLNNNGLGIVNINDTTVNYLMPNYPRPDNPEFTPDGLHIICDREVDGISKIIKIDKNGSNYEIISKSTDVDWDPNISPDGSKIVCKGIRDTTFFDLFIMDINGKNQKNLTNKPGYDIHPKFSPDGEKVFFIRTSSYNDEIYCINIDGSNEINLTNHIGHDLNFNFSSDGQKIVFISNRDRPFFDIYIMNSDGSDQTRLTDTGFNNYPVFTDDDSKIVYISGNDVNDNEDVYIMNIDGSNRINLTNNSYWKSELIIQPVK